jgi:hypothetical protein
MSGPDTLTATATTAELGGWSDPNLLGYSPESFTTLQGGDVAVVGRANYNSGSSQLLAFLYDSSGNEIAVENLASFTTSAFIVAPEILPMADGDFAVVWQKTAINQPPGNPTQANNDGEYRIFSTSGALVSGTNGAPFDTHAVSDLWAMTTPSDALELQWTSNWSGRTYRGDETVGGNGVPGSWAYQQDATADPPYPNAFVAVPNTEQVEITNYGFSYSWSGASYGGSVQFPGVPYRASTAVAGAALANAQVALSWTTADTTYVGVFDMPSRAFLWYEPVDDGLTVDRSALHVVALPDGQIVVSIGSGGHQYQVFDGAGHGGGWQAADTAIVGVDSSGQAYGVGVDANGQYFIRDYAIGSGNSTAPPPPTGDVSLVASGSATILTSAAGWTSAVVSSDHVLDIAGASAASYNHSGWLQTFDASGAQTSSTALVAYAGQYQSLMPVLTALGDGFVEATFLGGPSGEEIYNAAGQRVFMIDQYTTGSPHFFGLLNGGYVVTDDTASSFGLFDSSANNVGWFERPADGPSMPDVHGLIGGGFVFTYAGSGHFDVFQPNGQMLAAGDLGATASSFATGFAASVDGGFVETWLSPDGGQYGLATALTVQAFAASGAAEGAPVIVSQDLDPWHTTIQVQAHADGSDAVLWSQGGGIFGAEYAAGAAGPVYAAMAGDLSTTIVSALSSGQVGLTWQQDGEVWSELFDPATGTVQRAELGLSGGDLSTIHVLATANGGEAVSWHDGGVVRAAVLEANGEVGPTVVLSGDLLGADASGHGVTVHDDGHGHPVLQAFTLSDSGLFWTG